MKVDRRALIASLGGAAAVSLMGSEEKADALEDYLSQQLDAEVEEQQAAAGNAASAPVRFPTVAELEAQVETRNWRRGAGGLFVAFMPTRPWDTSTRLCTAEFGVRITCRPRTSRPHTNTCGSTSGTWSRASLQ